jgi:hypothetical protein
MYIGCTYSLLKLVGKISTLLVPEDAKGTSIGKRRNNLAHAET